MIDVNWKNYFCHQKSLLHIAVEKKLLSIVDTLVESGADLNALDSSENSLLHYAARAGNKKLLKLLLTKGIKVDLRNHDNLAPIHEAAKAGQ